MSIRPIDLRTRLAAVILVCLSLSCSAVQFGNPAPTPAGILATLETHLPTVTPPPTEPLPTAAALAEASPTPTPGNVLGPFQPVAPAPDPIPSLIRDVRVDPVGALWVSSDKGLAVLNQGLWSQRSSDSIIMLGFDGLGRLWTTDDAGDQATVWTSQASSSFGASAGWTPTGPLSHDVPYATVSEGIVTDPRGWNWLVTHHDVRAFDGEGWIVLPPDEAGFVPSATMVEMGFDFSLSDVALDATGDVWVTDCAWAGPGPMGQGARWFDGNSWQGQASTVVGSGCIKDMEVDASGRIWVGVDGDLWSYAQDEGWAKLDHPDIALDSGMRWGYLVDLALGGKDTVWVTMAPCGGASCDVGLYLVFRVRSGEWKLMSDQGVPDVAVNQDGNGWLCVGNRLYKVTAGELTLTHEGDNFACRLETDGAGRTWLWQPDAGELWVAGGL